MRREHDEPREFVLELTSAAGPSADGTRPGGLPTGTCRYVNRTADGPAESFEIDWDRLRDDLTAVRRPACDPAIVQRLGVRLGQQVDLRLWREIEDGGSDRLLCLTVRTEVTELRALPWELLALPRTGQLLGSLPHVVVRHEWPGTTTARSHGGGDDPADPREDGGQILFVWAASVGEGAAMLHWAPLRAACEAGHPLILGDDRRQTHATINGAHSLARWSSLAELGAELRKVEESHPVIPIGDELHDHRVRILHLLCRGRSVGSEYGLVLDARSDARVVSASDLCAELTPYRKILRLVVLMVVADESDEEANGRVGEFAAALHRLGVPAVVASRYPLSQAGAVAVTAALYGQLLGIPEERGRTGVRVAPSSLEVAIARARVALTRTGRSYEWSTLQLFARRSDGSATFPIVFRPFRGLEFFEADHHPFFFGRHEEIEEILARIRALDESGKPRFLVVAGASGVGKSSLIHAGVLPRLSASGFDCRVTRPDGAGWALDLKPGRSGPYRVDGSSALGSDGGPMVLLVDQFEELFDPGFRLEPLHRPAGESADPGDPPPQEEQRSELVRRLWRFAGAASHRTAVIVTVRFDALARFGELALDDAGTRLDSAVLKADDRHLVIVTSMRREQLLSAIESPARLVGLELDGGLAERMVESVESEPGALPLMEFALDRLWLLRDGRRLTLRSYEEEGGVRGALERRCDELLTKLETDEERRLVRRLLVSLVVPGTETVLPARRRVPLDELCPPDDPRQAIVRRLIARYVESRLLVLDEPAPVDAGARAAGPTVEFAHETLIRRWPMLQSWLKEDAALLQRLERIRGAVERYRAHRTLLEGAELRSAEQDVHELRKVDLFGSAEAIRAAAVDVVDRSRRRGRWRRFGMGLTAAMTLAVVVGAGRAVDQMRRTAHCEAAGSAIFELWNDDTKQRIRESLVAATRGGHGEGTFKQVERWIDRTAEAWREIQTEACNNATILDRWDVEEFDRAQWCLDESKLELELLVEELAQADARVADKAEDAAGRLKSAARCRAPAFLPPAPDLRVRDAVRAARRTLARSRSVRLADDHERRLALVRSAIDEADATGWKPLYAETRMSLALALEDRGEYPTAMHELAAAYDHAAVAGATEVATAAALQLISLTGQRLGRFEETTRWAAEVGIAGFALTEGDPRLPLALRIWSQVYAKKGKREEALAFLARARAEERKDLPEDHPSVLALDGTKALVLTELNRLGEARDLQQRILDVQTEKLGPEHPATLITRNNIGVTLRQMGEYAAAREHFEFVARVRERDLGREHPDTLSTWVGIAATHSDQGEFQKGYEIEAWVLDACKRTLGPNHPQTLSTESNFAMSLDAIGKNAEARRLAEQVLAAQEQHLGPEHPDTMRSLTNVAARRAETGDLPGARRTLEEALARQRRILGPDHPDTLRTLGNMASVLTDMGDHAGAIALSRRVVAVKSEKLGPDHPETLTTLQNLGIAIYRSGDARGATASFQEALDRTRRVLGPDHSDLAYLYLNLGVMNLEAKQYDEARVHLAESLRLHERAFGPDSFELANPLAGLAEVAVKQQRYADVIEPAERAMKLLRAGSYAPALLGSVEFFLAEGLWDAPPGAGRDRERALELARAAAAKFRELAGQESNYEQVEAWLRKRGVAP